MTALIPMRQAVFAEYLEAAIAGYAEDNVAAGRWPSEGALARSRADFADSLPQGLATPKNYLYEIQDDDEHISVGYIWFAQVEKHGIKSAFVHDVEIKPHRRRRGHARAALQALEPIVSGLGLANIGLHVFGHNPGAQALYRLLGYEVTGVNMLKAIRTQN